MQHEIQILPDAAAIAKRAAEEFLRSVFSAVEEKGSFSIVLAGGSTPKALYTLLVGDATLRSNIPWDKMTVFFGDERNVVPEQPDSNFRMATEALLSKAQPAQVKRIKGEYKDTEQAALEYEGQIREHFQLGEGLFPQFDFLLLGMGSEGHTASLFPGTKALHEPKRIVTHNWVGKLFTERITLTAVAINHAARIVFMVTGADKALALKGVLEGPYEPEQLPAQMIQPVNGSVLWLVDDAAGSKLSKA